MTAMENKPADQSLQGDRRDDRRYRMGLDLKWRLVRRRKVLDTGNGRTLDLSSRGVFFDAGRALPVGLNVEMSISWPALLHNVAPMQLMVLGRIVRSDGHRAAVHIVQHEFRTTGSLAEPRSAAVNVRSTPLAANAGNTPKARVLQ
jgi:hypothetical protein